MTENPIVFVVDDERAMRKSLGLLFKSVGIQSKLYESAEAFLDDYVPSSAGCLVVDMCMKGMSGLELQVELIKRGLRIPQIFISGYAEVPAAVKAMRAGAIDFLEKPFRDMELLERVQQALEEDAKKRKRDTQRAQIKQRIESLSPRESQILDELARGNSTKQIARLFGISPKTVDTHRSRVLNKMQARGVVDLVQQLHFLDR